MLLVELNLGDTFQADCVYRDANGALVNLTTAAIAITAFARSPDGLEEIELTVTLANQVTAPGSYAIYSDTMTWSDTIGDWSILIRYTGGTEQQPVKFSSERLRVKLL